MDRFLLSHYKDIITPEALEYLALLERKFGQRIRGIRAREKEEQEAIDQSLKAQCGYLQTEDAKAIRAGDWKVAETSIPDFMKTPGVILVSPADPEMIIKSQTTQKRYGCSPVANMIDFEDAFHLDICKALDGQRTLMQVKEGKARIEKNGKVYEYNRNEDGISLIRIRVNGFNTPGVSEIEVDGRALERPLFDFGLHCFHNLRTGFDKMNGPYYVLPKMDYAKALLWAEIFQFSENYFNVPAKTIKCSAIIETIKGDFQIQEVAFVLAGGTHKEIALLKEGKEVVFQKSYLESFCSGRHDRVFDLIKTYNHYPEKIFPESRFTGIQDVGAQQSWVQIAEIARLRGLTPVGGMVVALTSDPKTRESALKMTAESMMDEHNKGSIQAWEAMPDTTKLATEILSKPFDRTDQPHLFDPVFGSRCRKKRYAVLADIEKQISSNLYTTPKGGVSYQAIYNNINQAIEYMEAWLRGYGVIPYKQRLEPNKPILMQNIATTERARSELWTWVYHKIQISDRNQILDEKFFLNILDHVLKDIETAMNSGFVPKGKMSPPSFQEGYYAEAAEILKKLVLSDQFIDNIKGILFETYEKLKKTKKIA